MNYYYRFDSYCNEVIIRNKSEFYLKECSMPDYSINDNKHVPRIK